MGVYSTRFQGSKRRLLPWVAESIESRVSPGDTVFDVFAGSGIISYKLAERGFSIIAADRLISSEVALRAFIGNKSSLVAKEAILGIREEKFLKSDPLFLDFQGRFFPDEELRWLCRASSWGRHLRGDRRAAFFWALFQAALAKRPYNLFHRANLEMRTRSVERSFGNARTWERPFEELFERFLNEQRKFRLPAAKKPKCFVGDVLRMPKKECDLVYLDPPYIPAHGESIDYIDFYGFLDLLLTPSLRLDKSRQHRPLRHNRTFWERRDRFKRALQKTAVRYRDVPLVLSYRKDGYPEPEALLELLGPGTEIKEQPIHYALAKKKSAEILLIRPPLS